MGSGSFGGGGGGGGGGGAWGGGGTPVIRAPLLAFKGGRPQAATGGGAADVAARDMVTASVGKLLQFGRAFAVRQFCSPLTAVAYRALFDFDVVAFHNRDWAPIERDYGVGPGPGCLSALTRVIVDRAIKDEPDRRVREIVQVCLEDFFVRALGDDVKTYLFSDADAVLRKLDKKIFKSTSGYFLGLLLWRMVEKELERPPSELAKPLRRTTQNVADDVIEAFEKKFLHKDGVQHHRDLFRLICANQQWFFDQLRASAKFEKGARHDTAHR